MKLFRYLILFTCVSCNKKDKTTVIVPEGPVETSKRVLAQNLSQPWEIIWGPDNKIWMTERGGKISRVDTATGVVTALYTVPDVQAQGEGGLLGMVLHPDFSNSPFLYVAYNYNAGGIYKEKIVRLSYSNNSITGLPFTIIDNIPAANIHNGCRLLVVADKLFITTGDAANQTNAQSNASLSGKLLRLNLDGSIPGDNPIAGSPVWSTGHRNPQGLVYANNILYSSEHGPSNDDEVNIVEKGRNYGWPNVQGFCDGGSESAFCSANNVREPLKVWTPTIAVCGMDYYNNDLIPQWKNSLLMCTLKDGTLYQMKLSDDKKSIAETNTFYRGEYGRLRDICISPDGKIYLCTGNGSNDKIIVIGKK
jgi:aldose sugar dehydrogenase